MILQTGEALINDHLCFLAEPGWQLAIRQELVRKGIDGDALTTITAHFRAWCEIPGWLSACRTYLSDSESRDPEPTNSLLGDISSLRMELKTHQPPAPAPLGADDPSSSHSWYTFNEQEQAVGDHCSYIMALALLQRIILTLSAIAEIPSEDLEEDCQKLAATVIRLHSQVLKEPSHQSGKINGSGAVTGDPGPRNRIVHLRCAFAIAMTVKDYQSHFDHATDDERRLPSIDLATFDHFHDMLRARVRV